MDVETEREDSELRNDTSDPSVEDSSHITVSGNDEGGVPAEVGLSHHEEEEKHPAEAATSEPEDNSGDEPPVVDRISTSKDLDVSVIKGTEQPVSHQESVVFEINSDDGNGPSRLYLDTPDRERTRAAAEEEEQENRLTAFSAEKEDVINKDSMQVLQQLYEERDKASQRSIQLQKKLTEYLCKKSRTDTQLQWEGLMSTVSEQMHEYEKRMTMLTEVKQQLASDLEAALQREEELRTQSQERVNKVGDDIQHCSIDFLTLIYKWSVWE